MGGIGFKAITPHSYSLKGGLLIFAYIRVQDLGFRAAFSSGEPFRV